MSIPSPEMFTNSFEITEADKNHFDTYGFVAFKQVFNPEEVDVMASSLEDYFREQRGGQDFDPEIHSTITRGQMMQPITEAIPEVFYKVGDHPMYRNIANSLLGEDCVMTGGGDAGLYYKQTEWHNDGISRTNIKMIKILTYLDPVAEGSGCLSVLPGSNTKEFTERLNTAIGNGSFSRTSGDVPGRYPIQAQMGDVIAMDARLWHSAWGVTKGRKLLAFTWANVPAVEIEEKWYFCHICDGGCVTDSYMNSLSPEGLEKIQWLKQMMERYNSERPEFTQADKEAIAAIG